MDPVRAQGLALAMVGSLLERRAPMAAGEFGHHLALLAAITGETSRAEGEILAMWAALEVEYGQRIFSGPG